MIIPFLVAGVVTVLKPTAGAAFDASISSIWLKSARPILIKMTSIEGRRTIESTWYIVSKGQDHFWLRNVNPTQNGLEHSDRAYEINGRNLVATDNLLQETLRRKLVGDSPRARIAESIAQSVEPLELAIDPHVRAPFFASYRNRGLAISQGKDGTRVFGKIGISSVEMLLGPDHLLRRLILRKGTNTLQWVISPVPISVVTPMTSGRLVDSFAALPTLPRASNEASKTTLWRLVRGLRGLDSASLLVRGDDGETKLAWHGRSFHQDSSRFAWAYDKRELWILNRATGKFCRGPAKGSDLLDYVAVMGGRVHPFLRSALLRRPPLLASLTPDLTCTVRGTLKIAGEEAQVLDCSKVGRRLSVLVRTKDGSPLSVTDEILDAEGHRLSVSTQIISYQKWSVKMPTNQKAEPLPRLK